MKLTSRVQRVNDSPTLAITARANAMKAAGIDVISFGAGEPDFNTPAAISAAAKAALDAGHTRYTPVPGIPALREAIAADYKRRGRAVTAAEVIVTVGGKHALYNATLAVFEPGDRVIVPSPYWVSYPEQIDLADAQPVFVDCDASTDFKLTADKLATLLADDTITGLVLCSPSNPTGATYTAEELKALGEVLLQHPRVTVFFDAMYDRLYYDGDVAPDLVAQVPALYPQVITFNGFSKTYAMTGWRLGYAIGPKDIIAGMSKMQSQSTSNPTSIVQHAALAALKLDDDVIAGMRDVFRKRRDLIVAGLRDIKGVTCALPQGAFYVFPDLSAYVGGRFADDLALAAYLLEEAKVALVPGSAFGAPGFMRLSYATSDAQITEGLARLKAALESL
jgi:aspartate aminotransferase